MHHSTIALQLPYPIDTHLTPARSSAPCITVALQLSYLTNIHLAPAQSSVNHNTIAFQLTYPMDTHLAPAQSSVPRNTIPFSYHILWIHILHPCSWCSLSNKKSLSRHPQMCNNSYCATQLTGPVHSFEYTF